jgi:hypothetical protein
VKVRWNALSLRLRITPGELEALRAGQSVVERLPFDAWQMTLCVGTKSRLEVAGANLEFWLSKADLERFLLPHVEGVYLERDGFRYYLEKDFPCEHPGVDGPTAPEETFPRPEEI